MRKFLLPAAVPALTAAAAAFLFLSARAQPASEPETAPIESDEVHPAVLKVRDAQAFIESWPEKTRTAARALIDKYGSPDGVTDRELVWNDKDPWTQVRVYRDAASLDDPAKRDAFIQDTVDYKVPKDKIADLAKFDDGLVVDEARGTLSAHGESEQANTLALNLADDVVNGTKSVASARSFMRDTLEKAAAGKSSSYLDRIRFQPKRADGR